MTKSAYLVIDQAVRENRILIFLIYCISVAIVGFGISVMIYGMVTGKSKIAWTGSVPTALLWPALRALVQIRNQNVAIRLMEVSLRAAKSPKERLEVIKSITQTYNSTIGKPVGRK